MAESASRAGYAVTAIDARGDLDLEAFAEVVPLRREQGRPYSPIAAARVGRVVPADAVVYAGGFENHPRAVEVLVQKRALWGNPPDVLQRVRHLPSLVRALHRRGFQVPEVRTTAPPPARLDGKRWLLKPGWSVGGQGVLRWCPGDPVPRRTVLQERISGLSGSIIFAGDGRQAVTLAVCRDLVGVRALGAEGLRRVGSVLGSLEAPALPDHAAAVGAGEALAQAVVEEFGLVGVNALDFVATRGAFYATEVNPRYTAAMELLERAYGVSVFDIHARACRGRLPRADLLYRPRSVTYGVAAVYARRDLTLGDTRRWLREPSLRDVPQPATRIRRGDPICTVFAEARDQARCRRALVRRAAAIYRAVE